MATVQVDFNEYQLLVQQTEEIKQLKNKLSEHESDKEQLKQDYDLSLGKAKEEFQKSLETSRKRIFKTVTTINQKFVYRIEDTDVFDNDVSTKVFTINLDEITKELRKDLEEEFLSETNKLKFEINRLSEFEKLYYDTDSLLAESENKYKDLEKVKLIMENHISNLDFKLKEQSEYLETLSSLVLYKEKFEIITKLLKEGYGFLDSQSKLTKIYKILTEK